MNRPDSCLLVRFSFSVIALCIQVICVRFSFLELFCVTVYLCVCDFVVLDLVSSVLCLQCFDTVGWAAGRASGL